MTSDHPRVYEERAHARQGLPVRAVDPRAGGPGVGLALPGHDDLAPPPLQHEVLPLAVDVAGEELQVADPHPANTQLPTLRHPKQAT